MSKAEELANRITHETDWYEFDQQAWCNEAAAELRRLAAEVNDLKKDAERYRWLRLPDSYVQISSEAARDPVFYDAAIDHAMRNRKNA